MASLSNKEIEHISTNLQAQGITFEPLRQELLDHLICDIEMQMNEGKSFEEAWRFIMQNIPKNHFNNIQQETMELLNKKINPMRIFGIISLALLILATFFKIMHLAGAGVLLIAFLIAASVTLLIGSIRSFSVYQESKGRGVIMLITFLIIAFIVTLCFRVLQIPMAAEIMLFSVISICILFPALSIYFYTSKQKLKDYLLIRVIRENQALLEKIAIVLIGFGLAFNYSALLFGDQNYSGVIFFVFSIILTGLYIYSLTWQYYVEQSAQTGQWSLTLLVSSSGALIMFMIPVLGSAVNQVLSSYFAYLSLVIFMAIVFVSYFKFSSSKKQSVLSVLSILLLLYPVLRLGTKLEWFDGALSSITLNPFFSLGFLAVLIVLMILYRKEKLFKALLILTIAAHMIPGL